MMQSYQVCVSVIFWVSLLSEIQKKNLIWILFKKKKKKKHAATYTHRMYKVRQHLLTICSATKAKIT